MLQFASPAAGGSGLASLVEEASKAAIKVPLLQSARPSCVMAAARKPDFCGGAVGVVTTTCCCLAHLDMRCVQERGAFTLVLSGGSLINALSALIGLPGVDFSRWHVFFVDERNVPHTSPDSNFKGADEALLSKVGRCPYTLS